MVEGSNPSRPTIQTTVLAGHAAVTAPICDVEFSPASTCRQDAFFTLIQVDAGYPVGMFSVVSLVRVAATFNFAYCPRVYYYRFSD
jgi:hypothetical protein